VILAGAEVAPDAIVSDGTTVGACARVEAGATIESSVLFDEAIIEAGARVARSVVGKRARVCAGVVLDDAVIGDGAIVGPGNELRAGLRLWPGIDLSPTAVRFSADK
jgi:mannose-1-phosphate guanylyltransferase